MGEERQRIKHQGKTKAVFVREHFSKEKKKVCLDYWCQQAV